MNFKNILKSDLVKNISSLTLIQIANYIIPLILIPYVSRKVGVENYGKLEYARAFVLFFTLFIDYGFDFTATRETSIHRDNPKQLNKIFSQTMLAKFLLFIVSSIIFFFLLYFDQNLRDLKNVMLATYIINIGIVLFPGWFYQGLEKIRLIASINFVIKLVILSLTLVFLKEKSDFWIYNFLQSAAQIIVGIYTFNYAFKKFNIRLVKVKMEELLATLKTGFPIFVSSFLGLIIASFSFIILKYYVNEEDLGFFSTAFKLIITLQTILLLPFNQGFFPYMAHLITVDVEAYKKKIKQVTRILVLLNLGAIVFCFFTAEFIINILYGKDYLDATRAFQYFLLLPLLASLSNIFLFQGILTLKKDKLFMYIHLLFATLTIALNFYVIPKHGIYGAIYLRLLLEFSMAITAFVLFKRTIKNFSLN